MRLHRAGGVRLMGEIIQFPPVRMQRIRERIKRIRRRYAADLSENRLDEIGQRLRTIENAIAGLQSNYRAAMVEWRAELRRVQAAERRRRDEPGK
jgi:small-conductance mechanosensitive channel